MAAQTPIQQRPKPDIQPGRSAELTTTEISSTSMVQHDRHPAVHGATMTGEYGRMLSAPSADRFTQSTAVLVCAAILAASALFAAGFMRPQLERALRRLFERVVDMDVPLMLPVYMAEAVQELLVERRMIAKRP